MSHSAPPPDGGAGDGPPRWDGGTSTPPTSGPPRWDSGTSGGAQPAEGDELWQRPEGWRPPEQAQVPRRRIGGSVWVLAAVVLLLVVALVAWRLWPSSDSDAQEVAEDFLDAAVAGDCGRAQELSTGNVSDQLGALCGEQDTAGLAGMLGEADPTVEAVDVEGDEATADASLSIASFSLRVEMTLTNQDGEWLVTDLALPGGLPEELLGSMTP